MKRAVALLTGLSLIAGCSMEPKMARNVSFTTAGMVRRYRGTASVKKSIEKMSASCRMISIGVANAL